MTSARSRSVRGMVFDIQRFSVHDGPGIRTTVFLKGCPLRCPWCQNPESQNMEPELFFTEALCILCGECVKACPNRVHSIFKKRRIIQRTLCAKLGKCIEACPTGALELKGKLMTVEEVVAEVLKDEDYYEQSSGGVTLSGGEPLFQPTFATEILKKCKASRLHTAIETCGYTRPSAFDSLHDYVDLILYDLKHMDSRLHKAVTGVENKLILSNLKTVMENRVPLLVRLTLVPGFSDIGDNLVQMAIFLKSLGIDEVEIIPYHTLALAKYKALGIDYALKDTRAPSEEELRHAAMVLHKNGLRPFVAGSK